VAAKKKTTKQGVAPVVATKPRGRPTEYTADLAAGILDRITSGESLRSICKPSHMPAESTVRKWVVYDREGFSAQYEKARRAQMDALAEDLLEIADAKGDDVQRARLRVDTRKWLMSKIAPKRFGDRVLNEHSGPNGGPIQNQTLNLDPDKLKGMSDDELAALERAIGKLHGSAGGGESRTDDEGDAGSYSSTLDGSE
jgi:alkylated DNA nucleotide flippase Atl1